MKKMIFILSLILISCSKNEPENNDVKVMDPNGIEVEIVSVDSAHLTKILDGNLDDKNNKFFSEAELKKFNEKNIDANQLLKYIDEAENGDPNAINSLSYIYYLLGENDKLKEVLELGLKYNVKEAIFNLALLEMENKNFEKAIICFEKLPSDYKKSEIENFKSGIYLNTASIALKRNDYDKGLSNLIKAYNMGIKELDYEIANIYRIKGDEDNLVKWLKISSESKNIEAKKSLAEIYYFKGDLTGALKLYHEIYQAGEVDYAQHLYFAYLKLLNNQEALKWYKISRNLGLVDKNPELEKLKGFYNN
ncbi:tetratricopeptide repeat protein [Streptobacillus canis]|uniref:tetratricopeptide repeat protein n=1 Tax=Streptobacillus canis TaxID=2678686 RepID=UPI0012E2416C|nr:hypothetical protein [Streptobacillus canis]